MAELLNQVIADVLRFTEGEFVINLNGRTEDINQLQLLLKQQWLYITVIQLMKFLVVMQVQ